MEEKLQAEYKDKRFLKTLQLESTNEYEQFKSCVWWLGERYCINL